MQSILLNKNQAKISTDRRINISEAPSVTIGIPVLNEEDHIERVVSGFLDTEYPNLKEILIADGGSTDKTREIVKELSDRDSRVKLVENPEKFQSFGLNKMIEKAEGEIFLRADGHCHYGDKYLSRNIKVFLDTGAKNVGGAQRYIANNPIQVGISLAVKSYLGNGGAKYMQSDYEGYADTLFLGCFWTKDLKEIGGFSTKNITNQDSELNLRLIEHFGESVYVSPEIKSWYYPRSSFGKLFRQYFRYGRGRFLTKMLHPKSSPIRGLLPFLTVLGLCIYLIADLMTDNALYFPQVLIILAAIVLGESVRVVLAKRKLLEDEIWQGEGKAPNSLLNIFNTAASITIMQIAHFSGFLFQFLRAVFTGRKGW